jgi:hypothetical protein
MTAPTIQNLTHTRGDDFIRTITFSEDPATYQGIWFTVRESWATDETDDTDAISQAELGDGIVLTGGGAYTGSVSISNSETSGWTQDSLVYDVQIKTAAGKIRTTQRGAIRQTPDVTRSTT